MSKISLHIMQGPRRGYREFLLKLAAAGVRPAVIKTVSEFGAAKEAKEICGDETLTVGRLTGFGWEGFDQAAETVPISEMADVANRLWRDHYNAEVIGNPWIDVWEISNEWSAHWMWQAAMYVALAPYFETYHVKIGMFACSTGNPPDEAYPAIALACKDLGLRGHYLTLHEYGTEGMLHGSEPHLALRYRKLYDYLFLHDALAELIISEAGQNGGGEFPGVEPFVGDFAWYDSELMKDGYVIGAAAWTLGANVSWSTSNIQDALPALADYILAHPDPEPGLPPTPTLRGTPRLQYARTYNVVPANDPMLDAHQPLTLDVTGNEERAIRIFLKGWRRGRETTGGSYDDAGVGDLDQRYANLWDIPDSRHPEFSQWFAKHYPGVGLTFQTSTLIEPPPPPPPPPPVSSALVGVHHRADGGSLRAIDVEAIRQAKLTGYKFYKSTPDDYMTILGLGIPLKNCVTRLDHPLERHPVAFYTNGSTGIYDVPIQEALAAGVSLFEIFNEPNIIEGGLSTMWTTPGEFCSFCALLMDVLKTHYPNAKILTPAMSPQLNTQEWWNAMQTAGLFVRGAGIAAHSYWINRAGMDSAGDGRHYRSLLPYLGAGKKIWITEASNKALEPDTAKASQYIDYARTLEPQVAAVYFFCLSSSNVGDGELFNSRRETWVRPGALKDSISVIPGIVGTRPR